MYIPNYRLIKKNEESEEKVNRYLEFSSKDKILYDNIYLAKEKIVLKIPINKKANLLNKTKIETFSLNNTVFLLSY